MIREHHLRVERTARYATAGEPGPGVRELWIACHGFGQLASRFVRSLEPFASEERIVAAPEALNRFYLDPPTTPADAARRRVGATWMTREDREAEIADYVDYLDRLHEHLRSACPDASLSMLGFSQGVATVCRWAAFGHARAARLVLWSGPVPPDLDLARLAARVGDTRVTIVAGAADAIVAAADAEADAARLRAAAVPCDVVRHDGGHAIDPDVLARFAMA